MIGLLILPFVAVLMYAAFNIDEAYRNDFDE